MDMGMCDSLDYSEDTLENTVRICNVVPKAQVSQSKIKNEQTVLQD